MLPICSFILCWKQSLKRPITVTTRRHSFHLIKVLLWLARVGFDSGAARLPVGRTHLSVLLHELEGAHQPQRLVYRPSNGQVIDGHLAQHAFRVDQEQAPQRHALLLQQHAVLAGDRLAEVGEERVAETTETAAATWRADPGEMRELRVRRHADHSRVQRPELVHAVTEGGQLGGADEREVERVEKEHQVLAGEVGQLDGAEVAVDHGLSAEVGSRLLDARGGQRRRAAQQPRGTGSARRQSPQQSACSGRQHPAKQATTPAGEYEVRM